jgi:hypothetical protein
MEPRRMNVRSGALSRRRSGREISEEIAGRPTLVPTQSLNSRLKKALLRRRHDKSRRTKCAASRLASDWHCQQRVPRWNFRSLASSGRDLRIAAT